MAESARERESNDKYDTGVMSTEFTSLPLESEFSAVIFHNVSECYPPDRDIECCYTIKSSIKPNSLDWIGLFEVGWQSSREHYTYEWSPMPSIQDGEQGRRRVVFRLRYLPKADGAFYQFCYVTHAGDVRGASVPFQMKTKPIEQEELECYEIEDDELGTSIMIVKNKTEMLEESLARVLEENACLRALNEMAQTDLANVNDKVMESESRKADLTTALKENEKKASNLEQALTQKNLAFEEEQIKRRDLESANSNLNTMQENFNRKVDELMKMLEQERAQNSQHEKSMEMLVTECAEKIEKANGEIGRLQEQLVQITEENDTLKRNLEEESERLTKKVRDMYIELKNKDQVLDKVNKEIASYRCRIEEVESSKAKILRDTSHEAELLGQKIEKLQTVSNKRQELIYKLDQELEDANSQLEKEKGKITALEEDYQSVIRAQHDQLEAEKASKVSLCSQAELDIASLKVQVQKQLEANMDLSRRLERKNAELSDLCGERDNCKKQLQSAEEKLLLSVTQLTAVDVEVKLLKAAKEMLQTTLADTREASAQSAASMYALQTAYAHIETKYLQVKKQMEELWRERRKLKRSIATLSGNVPCDDLRLQMEEMTACNEDLHVRLNMGAEAFKMKFIECRQLEEQTNKVTRTSSLQSAISAPEEDYKSIIHVQNGQLDGEKALNQSLCSQAEHDIASLQFQMQKQVESNMELSQQLERLNAELSNLHGERDNCKKQLESAEEKLLISVAQLTAVDAEVKSLKAEKEMLQTILTDARGVIARSAASMYALQTAYAHIEKKYLQAKQESEELWRERRKLKRSIATFSGNVPCDDLHLQVEEMRACNEDLRVPLNMGAEAFKMKFIECRQLEEQLNKVTRTSSVQSEEAGPATEKRNKVSKLWRGLEEEAKSLNIEKSLVSCHNLNLLFSHGH